MKKLILQSFLFSFFLVTAFFANKVEAQTNTGIFFQAVARDVYSNPAKDRKIYIQSSIIQSSPTGTKVLVEEHQSQTDATGVFSISVGQGTRKEGTAANLTAIEWAKGPYYLNLKISIVPIAPAANWDYTKEWLDIGTTPFGTVPYALYSGSSGALDDKLNISDTSKMLALYAKAQTVQSLSTAVASKISVTDTSAMLAPYKAVVNALVASNITSLTAATVNAALDSKLNIADSITKYVTPTQLAAKTFDSTAIYKQIDKKADIVYVDSVTANLVIPSADSITNGTIILAGDLSGTASSPLITNKAITTAKVADSAITDSKILSISGSKVVGNITGKAGTATKLASPVTINGVSFDGSSNITIASAAANGLTINNSGTGDASGTVYDGSAAKTISYNSIGASPLAGSSSLTTVGTITSGVWSGTAITNNKLANSSLTIGSTNIALGGTSASLAGLSSVTSTNFTGNFTGDVTGNATTASTAGNISATSNTSLTSLSNLNTVGTITTGVWSGTAISLTKGGTGATTASAARTNLGLVIGTDVQAPLSFTAPLQSSSNTVTLNKATTSVDGYISSSDYTSFTNKIDATQKAANNGVATLGNDGKIPSNQIPAISFQSANVVTSESAMLALSSAVVGSIAIRTDNNNNYVLSALPASTLSNWIRLATPTSVTSVNGYAGPNVSLTTNDVSEGTTNKYYTDARVRGALSAVSPLSFNTSSGTFSMSVASGSSNGYLTSTDFTTFNNKQNAITAGVDYLAPNGNASLLTNFPTLNQNTTGNAATATKLTATKNINGVAFDGSSDITIAANAGTLTGTSIANTVTGSSLTSVGTITTGVWSGTTIALAKGGTGATTASAALTNLGAEASANKSNATDLGSTNPSDILYPSQKAVKTYVDLQSANAGVADLSITNAKLAGSITAAKLVGTDIATVGTITSGIWNGTTIAIVNGGTGATTSAAARSNLGLVIGTDVLAPNTSITGATKTKITYDTKGLVTTGADATTADIAPSTNRNYVTDAQSGVLSNTSGVNTGDETTSTIKTKLGISTLSGSNTGDQTITLTGDVVGNGTGSFATTVNSVGGVSSNTITSLPTTVSSHTSSITILDTRITSNTSSITSNTNSIATINTTLGTKADIASPAFTGVPTAPTPATSDNSTTLATTSFVKASITAANAGVSSVGAIAGTSNANGATISGSTQLILTPADANNGGVVTTGAQTFAGSKTFTNTVTFGTDINLNGMNVGRPGMPTYTTNTALGYGVLGSYAPSSSTYTNNTGIGNNALKSLTNGGDNTAVGNLALYYSTTSRFNTGIGSNALVNETTGSNNTGIGYKSGNNLTTGNDNVMVGYLSGFGMTTGANNTIIGSQTYSQTSGAIQIGLGITTGSNNTIIGSKIFGLSPSLSNNIILADGQGNIRAQHDGVNGWTLGTISSGTWSGTVIGSNVGGAGTVNGLMKANGSGVVSAAVAGTDYLIPSGNAATATALATGRTISTSGDVTYTSGSFDGSANVTGTATLTNTTVTAGTYGSSTAIPTFTVDSKGRLTAASTVGIIAGVNTLTYTTGTSYANGGTVSGTTLTLAAADANNPGLISTGAQTIAGAKTFNSDVTATNFLGNSTTATTAGNITATSNTTLTSLSNLATVGTITSGTWSATEIAIAKGGTGATTAAAARTNLGLVIGTDVMAGNATTTLTGDITGAGNGSFATTLAASGVSSGTYGSSTAIPVLTVDTKGRVTNASTVGITAGVSSLNYTSTTSYASGGTISGTSLTLAAADATNPGLISTGAQTIAGAKTFSSTTTFNDDITVNGITIGIGKRSNTSINSTALGNLALGMNTTGSGNTALGQLSMSYNTTGGFNSAAGSQSLNSNTTGNFNTAFGNQSLSNNTTGNYNTAVGFQAGVSAGNLTNATAIGNNALVSASNTIQLGNSSVTSVITSGTISATGFNGPLSGNATTATTAGNITATSNTTLTSLANLATVGTITSGTWSGTEIAIAKGGTGATTAAAARTNLGLGSVENTALSSWAGTGNITTVGTLSSGSVPYSLLTGTVPTWNQNTTGSAATLTTGRTISTTGDIIYTSGSFDGSANVTGTATLTNTAVTPGSFGSSTAIPTFTVDSKGRLTTASTVSIIADAGTLSGTTLKSTVTNSSLTGVGTITSGTWNGSTIGLAYGGTGATTKSAAFDALSPMTTSGDIIYGNTSGTGTRLGIGTTGQVLTVSGGNPAWTTLSAVTTLGTFTTTSYANGGTITGTTLTLSAADASNPGLISTGAQTFAGSKTFSNTTTFNSDIVVNSVNIGRGPANGSTNTAIGTSALNSSTASSNNVAIGYQSMLSGANAASDNTAVGSKSGYYTSTGTDNTFIGSNSGYSNGSGAKNTGIGSKALYTLSSGFANAGIGFRSLYNVTTGIGNIGVGDSTAHAVTSGNNNISIGTQALSGTTTGNDNIAMGYNTLIANISGNQNIGIGSWSLYYATGNNNVAVGYSALERINGYSNNTALGYRAGKYYGAGSNSNLAAMIQNNVLLGYDVRTLSATDDNSIVLAGYTGSGDGQIGLGSNSTLIGNTNTQKSQIYGTLTTIPSSASTGAGNASKIEAQGSTSTVSAGGNVTLKAGDNSSSGAGGSIYLTAGTSTSGTAGKVIANSDMTINGLTAGKGLGGVTYNTAFGVNALNVNTTGDNNTAIGHSTLAGNYTGTQNTAIGTQALKTNTASYNSSLGFNSLYSNTIGYSNAAFGNMTLNQNTTGNNNSAFGAVALRNNFTGSDNSVFGTSAGLNTTGSQNVFLGSSSGYNITGASNNIFLGYKAGMYYGTLSNTSNQTGDGNVMIGTDVRPLADGQTNQIVIAGYTGSGIGMTGNGSNTVTIGNSSNKANYLNGVTNLTAGTMTNTTGVNLTGSIDDFFQFNVQNTNNTGTKAQSGYAATADNGTNTTGFAWMGINNSAFNYPTAYNIGVANDVTYVASGQDMYIANANNKTSLIFSTGKSTSPYFDERMRITNSGTVAIGTTGATAVDTVNAKLHIAGKVKIVDGNQGAGKVLTSDANGLASWTNPGGSVVTMSATGTATSTAKYIIFTGSTASQTITIPSASTMGAGWELTIKNVASVSVSIAASSGYLIQDNSTLTSNSAALGIEPSNNWMRLVSDGTNWYIFRALF